MYNWSTDVKTLKKDKEKYAIWHIEQMVNFGLNNEKIRRADLEKYWHRLSLDPARRKFFSIFIHGRKHSH